jgi:predicted PurR-regulated permease PerM
MDKLSAGSDLDFRATATSLSQVSPESQNSDLTPVRALAITVIATAGAIYTMREGLALVAPVLVSVLLAYALEPFVRVAQRCRLPRPLAVLVVLALAAAAIVATGLLAQRQVAGFIDTLPTTVADLQRAIERAHQEMPGTEGPGPIDHLRRAAIDLKATIDASAPGPEPGIARVLPVKPPFNLRTYLAGASGAIAVTSAHLLAVALLTLLLLLTGESLKRKLIAIAGPRAQQKLTHDVIKAIDRQIERYLVARVLISAIVGAATAVCLWAIGVGQPLALGLIAGVLNVMPFVGPAAGVALIAVVAFVQFHTLEMTVAAGGLAGLVAVLEGNLVSPWLTSRAGELNTVAVFVSVLFWGWMWDVWGLVLAIPIMVAIKAAADHIEPLQPLGELLGR